MSKLYLKIFISQRNKNIYNQKNDKEWKIIVVYENNSTCSCDYELYLSIGVFLLYTYYIVSNCLQYEIC